MRYPDGGRCTDWVKTAPQYLMHPACALAALASSQEVREWLEMVVLETFPETTHHDVAVDRVLNALGGGE